MRVIKGMSVTVKATETRAPMPAWWGRAVGGILALERDPHALDFIRVIDMDAVHRTEARDD